MTVRDNRLDVVKGIAIIIVMIGHCIILNGMNDAYFYDAIVALQMPLFMMVSGFTLGMKKSLFKQTKFGICLKMIGKRCITYLVPFFAWMVLTHLANPFKELVLCLFSLDRGLWFLMTLWIVMAVSVVCIYASCRITSKCTKHKRVWQFLILMILLFIAYFLFFVQGRLGVKFLSPSLTVKYMPFYVLGLLISHYKEVLKKLYLKNINKVLFLLAILIFLFCIIQYDMIVVTDTVSLIMQMIASFAGCYMIFYIAYYGIKGKFARVLIYLGNYTLEIYVLHFRFARILGFGNKGYSLYSIEGCLWIVAAFVVMSVLTALSIFLIKKIPVLDLLLFGKRHTNYFVK